ncbi:putative aryl-alcohol dehydrogenase Aad14 [Chaetomium strumarium]|uniref:Aryl-alcohol dehydrogenase Aad14 n=1 Tax=Chaetomium strumarium TaxID=1170767 RepID=A0AAJ0GYY6_9PEZI|nr:putative aryl-alcohol dehydrogenase Aad14 [Chaetomium strumarium]
MAGFAPPPMPPDPPTELGRLRILSKTAGIRVSPLALGGGNIGQAWNASWGVMTKERSFELLDAYLEAGGNFIDTASTYQDGESEVWIGEWMAARKVRDRLVVATKYTSDFGMYDFANPGVQKGQKANHGGNSRRSLHMSVRQSLRRLQTDWIDILYVHWWDYTTSVEEVVDSLHILVQQGKVLYLGVCNTPAWIVSAANTYAKAHGKTQFSVYSGRWSLLVRDMEREIVPMARAFGMAIVPWGVLGQGKFQSDEAIKEREESGEPLRPYGGGREVELSRALTTVAAEQGTNSVTAIALAYILRKAALLGVHNVFPVVGGRKTEQLKDNIAALSIWLTEAQVAYLESVKDFDIGYPSSMIGEDPNVTGIPGHMSATSAYLAFPGATKR